MKTISLYFIITVIVSISALLVNGQGFQPPAPGKSVVYFAKLNIMGFNTLIEFYNNDKFIGCFSGRGYFRYECEPGQQLFWASSKNIAYLTGDLLPNEIYVVIIDVLRGGIKSTFSTIELRPVNGLDSAISKVEKLSRKESASEYSPSELIENTALLSDEIKSAIHNFEGAKARGELFYHIAPNMAVKVLVKPH